MKNWKETNMIIKKENKNNGNNRNNWNNSKMIWNFKKKKNDKNI